jgi:hypothetical protein
MAKHKLTPGTVNNKKILREELLFWTKKMESVKPSDWRGQKSGTERQRGQDRKVPS